MYETSSICNAFLNDGSLDNLFSFLSKSRQRLSYYKSLCQSRAHRCESSDHHHQHLRHYHGKQTKEEIWLARQVEIPQQYTRESLRNRKMRKFIKERTNWMDFWNAQIGKLEKRVSFSVIIFLPLLPEPIDKMFYSSWQAEKHILYASFHPVHNRK